LTVLPIVSPFRGSSLALEALNRLRWVDGFCFVAYGVRVGVRVDSPDLLSQIETRLPPSWRRSDTSVVDRIYSVRARGQATPHVVSVALAGRLAAIARTSELLVEVPNRTIRSVLDSLSTTFPTIAEELLRPDGQPRLSTFVRVHGTPAYSLDGELPPEATGYELFRGGNALTRTNSIDDLLEIFESDLHLYVAMWSKRLLFVHAGVIGCQGRAMVIPGRSFSGKTTLVTALVSAGASYYSDEYAAIDSAGMVHSYARPLKIRNNVRGGVLCVLPPTANGRLTRPLPVASVVVTEYRPEATWAPTAISPGETLLALLSNTVAARRRSRSALRILSRVASSAQAVKGIRGEAPFAARELLASMVSKS
jgi:hypothetical protein